MNQLHPVFQQALAPYLYSSRPILTQREHDLLHALQLMKGWCIQYAEPFASGSNLHPAIQRDLQIASQAVKEATGGRES